MYRALTSDQTRALEERLVVEGMASLDELMRRAGTALAACVAERVPDGPVAVLCGPGNNGGDGWVCARELAEAGRAVRVFSTVEPSALSGPAAGAAREALEAGVAWSVHAEGLPASALAEAAVVVDALLGTGAGGPLRRPVDAWCRAVRESGGYVVSADLPTGVDADTGAVAPDAVIADCTVTFLSPKRGLVTHPGAAMAGEVVVADLGFGEMAASVGAAPEILTADEYAALVPRVASDAHKNSRGRLLIVAGSGRYPGAAVLAARGAARMGAGYVTLAVPEPVVGVMHAHLTSVTVVGLPAGRAKALSSSAAHAVLDLARDYDAVVLGPGLSLADGAVASVRTVVSRLERPLVIDADALNALVDALDLVSGRAAPTVLTPHPGELARLLGITTAEVQADRVSSCARLAGAHRAVVLKGAGTVIADAERLIVNVSGSPALATAGTGDVLAGMIGALLAQGLGPLEAGALGAYVHGRAGEEAAAALTPLCVTADDVPDHVPSAVAGLLEYW